LSLFHGFTYHVVGKPNYQVAALFESYGFEQKGLAKADVLVFTGGADVNPALYREAKHPMTHYDPIRDEYERKVFDVSKMQYKIGICRGGQLLNVLSGGKMFQDVDGHRGKHLVLYYDNNRKTSSYFVTSTHHQMMKPVQPAGDVWAWASKTTERSVGHQMKTFRMPEHHWVDPEVVYYKETNSLCFQPHPEYENDDTRKLFFRCLNRFMVG
jgi:GMP synthase-like glutamine amidotransferase